MTSLHFWHLWVLGVTLHSMHKLDCWVHCTSLAAVDGFVAAAATQETRSMSSIMIVGERDASLSVNGERLVLLPAADCRRFISACWISWSCCSSCSISSSYLSSKTFIRWVVTGECNHSLQLHKKLLLTLVSLTRLFFLLLKLDDEGNGGSDMVQVPDDQRYSNPVSS